MQMVKPAKRITTFNIHLAPKLQHILFQYTQLHNSVISITRGIRAQSQAAAYITDTQRIYHSLMKWQHSFISFSAGSSTQSSSFNSVFTTMKKLESTLSTIVRSLLFLLNINQILKCIADALPDFTKQNQHPIFKLSKAKNLGQKHYCSTIHRET